MFSDNRTHGALLLAIVIAQGLTGCRAKPGDGPIVLRFIVASDGHFEESRGTDSTHLALLGWLEREREEKGLDLFVYNGDLGWSTESEVESVVATLSRVDTPVQFVRGNHDRLNDEAWSELVGSPPNATLSIRDTAFVFASSSTSSGAVHCPDERWTRDALTAAESEHQTFFFSHVVPTESTASGDPCEGVLDALSDSSNLRATFHGHRHDLDSCEKTMGLKTCFDGHMNDGWGLDYRGYRVVEQTEDGTIYTYQTDADSGTVMNADNL